MLHTCMDLQYDYYQGPFRLVAEEGKSKCSWVSLDDISNIFIRGILSRCFYTLCFLLFCVCTVHALLLISIYVDLFAFSVCLFIPSLLDGNLGMHMWVCTEFVLLSLNFNLLRIFHICLQRWNFKKWKKKKTDS